MKKVWIVRYEDEMIGKVLGPKMWYDRLFSSKKKADTAVKQYLSQNKSAYASIKFVE